MYEVTQSRLDSQGRPRIRRCSKNCARPMSSFISAVCLLFSDKRHCKNNAQFGKELPKLDYLFLLQVGVSNLVQFLKSCSHMSIVSQFSDCAGLRSQKSSGVLIGRQPENLATRLEITVDSTSGHSAKILQTKHHVRNRKMKTCS